MAALSRHQGNPPCAYFLSFEHGVKKPDPRIFQMACDKLGVAPDDALMVGDEPIADVGAATLGCRVQLVDPLPVDQRPGALAEVLQLL
ncbi:HAD-IA family hydrolase [Streptomyces murinus]|uniref:HAD superfamily hydrolase (TIGR01493 family) n=2 Tax=Streptomyces murinus TaxID=33900 RepID=A0A7W3NTJ1_STRMR|nr:HAD superfamily hydrolase (TIGR01493 family) [Streptomyces murinus]